VTHQNSPDTPVLRGLLAAIKDKLDVPAAAHHADDDLYTVALRVASHDVQLAIRALLDGPLDNVAIQSYANMLHRRTVPLGYETTGHAA
jgi:hypothetical protein